MWKFVVFLVLFFASCSTAIHENLVKKTTATSVSNVKRDWTIMFYMAADNNLTSEAIVDIQAIENSTFPSSTSVLCLLDNKSESATKSGLYELSKKGIKLKEYQSLNMANSKTLESYLDYSFTEYPAEKFALILWGHSSGWKSMFIDDSANDTMPINELADSIENSLMKIGKKKIDIIAFDASFTTNSETICEFKDIGDYYIGNVDLSTFSGWDYDTIFSRFDGNNKVSTVCDCFLEHENISIISIKEFETVLRYFNDLCRLLSKEIINYTTQSLFRDILLRNTTSYVSENFPSDMFINIYDFCLQIENSLEKITINTISQNHIKDITTNLKESLTQCVDNFQHGSNSNYTLPGLSVYLTSIQNGNIPTAKYDPLYNQTNTQLRFFTEATEWVPTNVKNKSFLDKVFFTHF